MIACNSPRKIYKLSHIQGDPFDQLVRINKMGFDWTGTTVRAHVKRSHLDLVPTAILGVRVLTQGVDTFEFELFSLDTSNWKGLYVSDIEITRIGKPSVTWVRFEIEVIPEITKTLGVIVPQLGAIQGRNYALVHQPGHGFVGGDGIGLSPTGWVKSSITGTLDNGLCLGTVDADNFYQAYTPMLYSIPGHGYPINKMLFVSNVPGRFTDVPPAPNQTPLVRLLIGHCPDADNFAYLPQTEPK